MKETTRFLGTGVDPQELAYLAAQDEPLLITGETGVGKSFVAKEIHRRSRRSEHRFVAENMLGIPTDLFMAELAGYKRGAFTGADADRDGLLTRANGGTAFLDEIGHISPQAQGAILRILEEGVVRPVGSMVDRQITARIITATNRDLRRAVDSGQYRADLFYRLQPLTLHIAELKERKKDIEPLALHFAAERAGEGKNVSFTTGGMDMLREFPWPGNIRQLRNTVRLIVSRIVFGAPAVTSYLIGDNEINLYGKLSENHEAEEESVSIEGFIESVLQEGTGRLSANELVELVDFATCVRAICAGESKTSVADSLKMSRRALYGKIEKIKDRYDSGDIRKLSPVLHEFIERNASSIFAQ